MTQNMFRWKEDFSTFVGVSEVYLVVNLSDHMKIAVVFKCDEHQQAAVMGSFFWLQSFGSFPEDLSTAKTLSQPIILFHEKKCSSIEHLHHVDEREEKTKHEELYQRSTIIKRIQTLIVIRK